MKTLDVSAFKDKKNKLKYKWNNRSFRLSALNYRLPVFS